MILCNLILLFVSVSLSQSFPLSKLNYFSNTISIHAHTTIGMSDDDYDDDDSDNIDDGDGGGGSVFSFFYDLPQPN